MRNIFSLFFGEALLLGVMGAVVGSGISILVSRLMTDTMGIPAMSGVTIAVGVVAAWAFTMALTVIPAVQASRMAPAEAIRSE